MAMKKSDIETLSAKEREAKIQELELAMLELRGEGRADKARPLKKTIARLKTPSSKKVKKS
jgi:ribosomal protein L29